MRKAIKKIEGRRNPIGGLLCRLYPRVSNSMQGYIRSFLYLTEGKYFLSVSLRRIFRENYGVEIGMYSYGACFERYNMDRNTTIGRYCSIANGVATYTHNHPSDYPSSHSFFFNPDLGVAKRPAVEHKPLAIGNDVWLGHNVIILPGCSRIGDGAIIGAGSIVTKDVEPYSVMVGNPARLMRYRFDPETIRLLQESRWWEKSPDELDLDVFTRPLRKEDIPRLFAPKP